MKEVLTDNQVDMVSDLSNIEIHIYFMLERMKLERDILLSQSEIEAVEDSKAQELSSQVLAKLTTIYPINFSPGEINYLAIRIASTIPSVRSAFTFDAEATQLMDYLVGQVDEMFNYQLKEDDLLKKISYLIYHRPISD
ncbi:PRD domain-containing protein [Streptococcus parauberis]|uniref:PRD domain-containing protein n=1 Tax=Streptococcus parauberis TaxID=1348 RepID=UPI0027DB7BEF|nr:PRD domain-containing protein [Streptococcus parauberis]WEM63114.1 PRD domain-containing protein [Streptococcus parauberis]